MKFSDSAMALHEAECSLLLDAARVVRRRYVHRVGGAGLSPAEAAELVNTFEAIASNQPGVDNVGRKEAIALAHRLIDDDHPEHSGMWPAERAG